MNLQGQIRNLLVYPVNGTAHTAMKTCSKCKQQKELTQFYKKTGKTLQSYCKRCLLDIQMKRWKERKIKAIEYKGGKCVDCNIIYPSEVYQFHHLDPSKKEFAWNKGRLRNWESIKIELDKCILLCANCHTIRHSKDISDYN